MEIALSAVADAGRSRMAAITAEVGAHVVLLAAQQVAPRPFHVTADSVLLSETGEVRLLPLPPASPQEVEMELRQLLAGLIGLAPSAPPALKAAAERGSGGGLEALEAELHAALIPINHAAARRALARLFRETRRASGAAGVSLEVTPTFAGEVTRVPRVVATTPTPASALPRPGASPVELDIDVDVVEDESSKAAASEGEVVMRADMPPPVMRLGNVLAELPKHLPPSTAGGGAQGMEVDSGYVEQHGACRSDVRDLLASFLAHTRSEEQMGEELRRMLGVERGPSCGTCFATGVLGSDVASRR